MQVASNVIDKFLKIENLAEALTAAGLEVESVRPASGEFTQVVVGLIKQISKHPDADKLRVCEVEVADGKIIQIVTNLQAVVEGMRLPVALVGAVLADGMQIKAAKLRGVASDGMFCSCESLGIDDSSLDILEFSDSVAPGTDIAAALELDGTILDIAITPNRGDCLSYRGVLRQLAAYTRQDWQPDTKIDITAKGDSYAAEVNCQQMAPLFAVRNITNLSPDVPTPIALVEFLRRSGMRSVNLVVDCLNIAMLEHGQPLHAYDADKLQGALSVRLSKPGEQITLLSGDSYKLTAEDIVVCDSNGPQALAGVMGGLDTSVTAATTNVVLEAAYFDPKTIAKTSKTHNLSSDSSFRFERGVDPEIANLALDRAAELICNYASGEISKITQVVSEQHLPKRQTIKLRTAQVGRLLGMQVADSELKDIMARLGCELISSDSESYTFETPSFRHDLHQEADLIEEILIIYGVDKLPQSELTGALVANCNVVPDSLATLRQVRAMLATYGYHEAITYSFISDSDQLDLNSKNVVVKNPISQDMNVMRNSLIPGLLRALEFNLNHQRERVALFEIGDCFSCDDKGKISSCQQLSALSFGSRLPVQWGEAESELDIYDVKQQLANILTSLGYNGHYKQVSIGSLGERSASIWHPGRSFALKLTNGYIFAEAGQLHPQLAEKYDIERPVYFFNINLSILTSVSRSTFYAFGDFPSTSRDLSLVTLEEVAVSDLTEKILEISGDLLDNIQVFDVYRGQGVQSGSKSIGLNLTFSSEKRTLVEEEVNDIMQQVIEALDVTFGAKLRT